MSGNHENKGWANPAPAGLVALAVACFLFFAMLSGAVRSPDIFPLMGCWLLGGFVVQVCVGLIELREGALTGGNVFLFFSAFFMLAGGLEFFVKYYLILNDLPMDTRIDGWAWLVLFIILVLYTFAYLKESSAVMGFLLIILTISAGFVTLLDLGLLGAAYKPIPAYGLLITGCLGIYQSAAMILNNAYKKQVLPTGKPLIK